MTHSLYNSNLETEITVDETLCENTSVTITNVHNESQTHYLSPKQLNDFIGVLLHIQAKKRKEYGTKY